MAKPCVDPEVAAIRAFTRFYTRKIGVVDGIASSPFSLAKARVLDELAHREQSTATDISKVPIAIVVTIFRFIDFSFDGD